jgi:hypothetical protein
MAIRSVQILLVAGCNTGNVWNTLMENLLASKLNAKLGEHLFTIPGACSLHLDTPIIQMVLHGIPTTFDFGDLQTELTSDNPGLVMAVPQRCLTKPEQRKEKRASSLVISLLGKRAKDVTSRPHHLAFSTTLRAERKLRFSPSTKCARCRRFGHHTTRWQYRACCRWCTGLHSTGAHSCTTKTCSANSRPCTHTLTRSALCAGPHKSHFTDYPSRLLPLLEKTWM